MMMMRRLFLLCLAEFLCWHPAPVGSCKAVATQSGPDFIHWSCNGCDSKFGCCNLIQFTQQLAWAKKDVVLGGITLPVVDGVAACVDKIAALSDMEGAFSLVSYERAFHRSRDATEPHHQDDFVVQQYRGGRWNRTLVAQFAVEPILPYRVKAHFDLSKSGGMHRALSINLNLVQVSGVGSISMLLVLTEDFFVDIEHLIETPCKGDFQSCHVTIHSTEIIDMEEPAFVSPQHAVRLEVLWHTPLSMEPSLSFALSIHARYPKPIRGGYVVAKLPAPILLGVEGNNIQPLPPLLAHIPAGLADDGTFVTLATAVCSVVGSVLLLRDLSRVSRWN
jgi:hypothetical protein